MTLSGTDAYSDYGTAAFTDAAEAIGLQATLQRSVIDDVGTARIRSVVESVRDSSTKIVFLMCHPAVAGEILREAYNQGVLGPTSGFVWVFPDGVGSNLNSIQAVVEADGYCDDGVAVYVRLASLETHSQECSKAPWASFPRLPRRMLWLPSTSDGRRDRARSAPVSGQTARQRWLLKFLPTVPVMTLQMTVACHSGSTTTT